jgi:type IV pilus secretin PilQ/predicted competence protein
MVKVGSSMKRANRILVVATVVAAVGASGANASLFGHRKTEAKPAANTAAVAGATLNAIDVDGSRITLRTSATPVFTSYNSAPDVFVVDLTATTKGSALTIPATLPAGVTSVSAEEAVEMGARLTRVTVRLAQPLSPQAAGNENNLVITLPAVAAATTDAAPVQVAALPPVELKSNDVPHVEPIADPAPIATAAEPKVEPVAVPAAASSGAKAKKIQRVETSGSGANVQVKISGDGALTYKAFTLEKPSRLVIDFSGVKNAVAKSNIAVSDGVVKGVRVGQFATAPTAVARVVVDLSAKAPYHIAEDGDAVRVTFGEAPAAAVAVAEVPKTEAPKTEVPKTEAPKPEPVKVAEVKAAPADVPSQVPTVAPEATTWKMPAEPKPAKHAPAKAVINATADQTPPSTPEKLKTTTTTNENVFSPAPAPVPSSPVPEGTRILSNPAASSSRTLGAANQKVYTGEPLSLNLKEADIRDVLRTFGDLTGLNIAVDPDVSGKVTVNFNEVPWDQALDIILRQNSLNYVLEGNVLRVGRVDRLAQEQQAQRRLEEEQRLNVNTITAVFKLSYARATEVQNLIREIASPRARIIVDQRTNQLIVSEIPTYLATINDLINTVDVPTRQVMIEARIVEASKVFQQQYGFSWGFSGAFDPALGNGTGLIFPNRVSYTGGPFDFSGGGNAVLQLHLSDVLGTFNLDFALNAFEFEGLVKVISAPKITTQDNVAAEIQSGFQIPYQTRINFTTTIQYVDATLRLSVTPQITEAGTVIMDIAVQKNEPTTGLAIEGAAGTPLSTRTAHTRLMVRDGGTAVIGGIYQVKDNDSRTRLPFVYQIPIIGNLFKTHNISTSHDELLIFITPRIIRGA